MLATLALGVPLRLEHSHHKIQTIHKNETESRQAFRSSRSLRSRSELHGCLCTMHFRPLAPYGRSLPLQAALSLTFRKNRPDILGETCCTHAIRPLSALIGSRPLFSRLHIVYLHPLCATRREPRSLAPLARSSLRSPSPFPTKSLAFRAVCSRAPLPQCANMFGGSGPPPSGRSVAGAPAPLIRAVALCVRYAPASLLRPMGAALATLARVGRYAPVSLATLGADICNAPAAASRSNRHSAVRLPYRPIASGTLLRWR